MNVDVVCFESRDEAMLRGQSDGSDLSSMKDISARPERLNPAS